MVCDQVVLLTINQALGKQRGRPARSKYTINLHSEMPCTPQYAECSSSFCFSNHSIWQGFIHLRNRLPARVWLGPYCLGCYTMICGTWVKTWWGFSGNWPRNVKSHHSEQISWFWPLWPRPPVIPLFIFSDRRATATVIYTTLAIGRYPHDIVHISSTTGNKTITFLISTDGRRCKNDSQPSDIHRD